MKRLVSIITIFFCIYSIFAVTLERKTVLDIFGDPIKEKALTLSEPLEGKFSDSLHDQEPFSWTVSIDENGYVSFDIFENGIPCDFPKYYSYTIAFKVDDTQTPIESSAYVTKSDTYHYNRVVSEKPLIQHVAKAKTVKIVIYNSSCVYNLGAVDVSGLGDLYYDLDSYNKALELVENKELNKAKEILKSMDLPSFNYFDCNSLIDEIDTALYLNTAEEKCAEGNYEEASALLNALQRENSRVYFSDKTKSLINNLYFLVENKELNKVKEILKSMDLPSFNYFDCNSLIDKIDTALYLNTAEEKCAEGNYEEASALLDALQRENSRVYHNKCKSYTQKLA